VNWLLRSWLGKGRIIRCFLRDVALWTALESVSQRDLCLIGMVLVRSWHWFRKKWKFIFTVVHSSSGKPKRQPLYITFEHAYETKKRKPSTSHLRIHSVYLSSLNLRDLSVHTHSHRITRMIQEPRRAPKKRIRIRIMIRSLCAPALSSDNIIT
jgi:hypothetical protein